LKLAAVVVAAGAPARVREDTRAAVGLGLRGGQVAVWLEPPAAAHADDPEIARALATLRALGHEVTLGKPDRASLPPGAAIERWTDGGGGRELWLGAGSRRRALAVDALDPERLVAELLEADDGHVW
jgi:hypothetical protein